MMTLGHDDLGCGMATLFGMPGGQYSNSISGKKTWVETFLKTTVRDRMKFVRHTPDSWGTGDFSMNGLMPDGTRILHLRTAKQWLKEYWRRINTIVVLGKGQNDGGMGEGLLEIGFKRYGEFPNPIMSYNPVYLYIYPGVTQAESAKLQKPWQEFLKWEREAMVKAGLIPNSNEGYR